MTKYGRPDSVAPASNTLRYWMIHECNGLALRLESGHNAFGVHPRLDDFQCDRLRTGASCSAM